MYVQNISKEKVVLNNKGQSVIIEAGKVQYIPDCLATKEEIKRMFSDALIVLDEHTGLKQFIGTEEQVLKTGILYLTEPLDRETARIYIGGTEPINVYGSDSVTEPKVLSEMSSPKSCQAVLGVNDFGAIPKYMAFEGSEAVEIVVTNLKCHEVGKIA